MKPRAPRASRRIRPLRLHFATFELAPLVQTGGLGDAADGLARALVARGHAVTCVLPAHRDLLQNPRCPALEPYGAFSMSTPAGDISGRWLGGALGGVRLRLLDLPALYDRPYLYGPPDAVEALRYIALSRAAASLAATEQPDVLVAHDWHAALSACVLRTCFDFGAARGIGTVQIIHNGAFLGRFGADAFAATGLPGELFHPEALEFWGDLALLKGGVAWADRIVAVSPRYAEELQTAAFGAGIDGLYRFRAERVLGITNGIDAERYDPATDATLAARFGAQYPKPRAACRAALLDATGLDAPEPGRLLAAIGRLASQKGWDVLLDAVPALIEGGASLVLVGDGDPALVTRLRAAAARWPRRVFVAIGWDEDLSRRTYAGSDCTLVPSRFEPCGLVQLLAQRYGSLPVAHRTGGLVDTIEDAQTGILFEPLTSDALVAAVERAVALMREQGPDAVVRRLLALDVSWSLPAASWERVFAAVKREAARRI